MQGCALVLPGGPWHFTFAREQLENLSFSEKPCAGHPGFHRLRALGSWSTALKFMGLHGNLTQ